MTHVMFDLETFGTRPGSVLRSIGAVVFDPRTREIGKTFYANIDKQSCLDVGLTVDASTEKWWSEQSAEAQASLLVDPKKLASTITDFHKWFQSVGGVEIWCQGANFDSVLWEAAAAATGARVPWKFWNVRDTRTAYYLGDFSTATLKRAGTYHNALDDAVYQAKCVQCARLGLPAEPVLEDMEG